ncbi:ImmA/IrrE family metallo-endopeptidase [Listeria monocytogenes]|uniref:HTH cro/C1-type domain-containing protein n=1 Tax=Listeria monocytogenes TaxID=1639 RepID=A0AB37NPT8_LISMN|nr:ImmA/IrrE family metallo-endopeptidase [Listeria monocytogenes]EAC7024829.1 ImmA/IrrE family metallo-endopeptidase [Listeria monocytogenes]EHD1728423.1 ImmA/IrrE family metallo-endopeptidase [Listeria monocytogenes]EHR3672356.1 ImmA/IrrE family metallo-endopeptidase [Listeria monocytogenes]EKZ4866389.1 ImmA/IrrE family metallo-endopeptidase [Listeria monocytogenes]RKC01058.1 hypothetical protein AE233_01314 [Listeria monocytogenes]
MVVRIEIDASVLSYYIHKSKVSLEQLQGKISDINLYLNGEKMPTFNQISNIAKTLNIPTGLLLIEKKLDTDQHRLSFRTLNSRNMEGMSFELRDTISEMQLKQDFLREEVEHELDFIGKYSIKDDYIEVVNGIRSYLDIPVFFQKKIAQKYIMTYLREKINQLGVFIFFNGKVKDNTHRNLDLNEFRGFVLSDKKAPLIFINQKDTKNGQLFTLVHELVHLFIGEEEIFNIAETKTGSRDKVETFVNKVTAELLVPMQEFVKHDLFDTEVLSKTFKVSEYVIVRRLLDMNKITKIEYDNQINELEAKYEMIKNIDTKSGGDYNNNLKFRIDNSFFNYIQNAISQNKITYTEAFNIIGVGYKGYKTLSGGGR